MVIQGLCSFCEAWLVEAINEFLRRVRPTGSQQSTSWPWRALSDLKPQAVLQTGCCWFCTHVVAIGLENREFRLRELRDGARSERGWLLTLPEEDGIDVSSVDRNTVPFIPEPFSYNNEVGTLNPTLRINALSDYYDDIHVQGEHVLYYRYREQDGYTSPSLQRYPNIYEERVCQLNHSAKGFFNPVRRERLLRLLSDCSNHHNCLSSVRNASSHSPFVPLRLLEISNLSGLSVRLVETSTLSSVENVVYATLSHVWGTKPFETLTQTNITAFYDCIPIASLARTFQETIQLCSILNIHYIWLDSLCIIQGSTKEQDWLEQAPIMHLVYENAILNIAACSSVSSDGGLFRPFNPDSCHDLFIDVPDKDRRTYRFGFVEELSHYFGRLPLFQRSWVVQELLLAPRVLFVSDIAVYWQCSEGVKSETGKPMERHFNSLLGIPRDPQQLDRAWLDLIEQYSRTKVTVLSDRIHAMAGLAAFFATRYRELGQARSYMLGCWEHRIAEHLVWQRAGSNDSDIATFSTTSSPLASWSWLAYPGEVISCVKYDQSDAFTEYLFRIPHFDVELSNPNSPYGAIATCDFEARAQLCRFDLSLVPDTEVTVRKKNSEFRWNISEYRESLSLRDDRTFSHLRDFMDGEENKNWIAWCFWQARVVPDQMLTLHQFRALMETCRCMFVGATIASIARDMVCSASFYGLVLVLDARSSTRETQCYRRVGSLEIITACTQQDEDLVRDLVRLLNPDTSSAEIFKLV